MFGIFKKNTKQPEIVETQEEVQKELVEENIEQPKTVEVEETQEKKGFFF